MKVLFLSDDEWNILNARYTFYAPKAKGVFQLHMVHEAKEILENTDLEDPSIVVYLDMAHSQAEYVMKELHHSGIRQKLIIGILCRRSNIQDDMMFAVYYKAQFLMRPRHDSYHSITDYLLKVWEERGLT